MLELLSGHSLQIHILQFRAISDSTSQTYSHESSNSIFVLSRITAHELWHTPTNRAMGPFVSDNTSFIAKATILIHSGRLNIRSFRASTIPSDFSKRNSREQQSSDVTNRTLSDSTRCCVQFRLDFFICSLACPHPCAIAFSSEPHTPATDSLLVSAWVCHASQDSWRESPDARMQSVWVEALAADGTMSTEWSLTPIRNFLMGLVAAEQSSNKGPGEFTILIARSRKTMRPVVIHLMTPQSGAIITQSDIDCWSARESSEAPCGSISAFCCR
jgi:hypothetical protein